MGQKISPKSLRTGIIYNWQSRWFAKKVEDFSSKLREDVLMREFLLLELKDAAVDRVDIERAGNSITISVYSAKPGFVIGRAGAGAENLKKKLQARIFGEKVVNLNLNIIEVNKPSLSSRIVLSDMVREIEKRTPARRVLTQALERIEKSGALGGKVKVAGRLNGAEIARRESLLWGKVPLHNLRADIDYSQGIAHTIYGVIGVKVWVYRGEIFK